MDYKLPRRAIDSVSVIAFVLSAAVADSQSLPSLDSRLGIRSPSPELPACSVPVTPQSASSLIHLLHCCNPFLSSVYQKRRSTCIRFLLISTPFANARGPTTSTKLQSTTLRSAFSSVNRITTSLQALGCPPSCEASLLRRSLHWLSLLSAQLASGSNLSVSLRQKELSCCTEA